MNGCDIITCTPGRVLELFKKQAFSVDHIRFFVLDEADSIVANDDYMRTVRHLHTKIPKSSSITQRLQMIVCSATLHNAKVTKLAVSLILCIT